MILKCFKYWNLLVIIDTYTWYSLFRILLQVSAFPGFFNLEARSFPCVMHCRLQELVKEFIFALVPLITQLLAWQTYLLLHLTLLLLGYCFLTMTKKISDFSEPATKMVSLSMLSSADSGIFFIIWKCLSCKQIGF